jgi:hypothetical protein
MHDAAEPVRPRSELTAAQISDLLRHALPDDDGTRSMTDGQLRQMLHLTRRRRRRQRLLTIGRYTVIALTVTACATAVRGT